MTYYRRFVECPDCKQVKEVLKDSTVVLHGCRRLRYTDRGEFEEVILFAPPPYQRMIGVPF